MASGILEKLGIDFKTSSPEVIAFLRGFINEYKNNMDRFDSKASQDYFHNLIAAIMLEYRKSYENYDIRIPYRIKSAKSVLDKVLEYLVREEKSEYKINDNGEFQVFLKEELSDMFGMTIVAGNRPPVLSSNDPEIKALIEDREVNRFALANMQNFKLNLIDTEFSGTNPDTYNFSQTRSAYYLRCIFLINKIKTLIHPNAKVLLDKYNLILEEIKDCVPEAYFSFVNSLLDDERVLQGLDTPEKLDSHFNLINLKLENCGMSEEEKKWINQKFSQDDVNTADFLGLLDDYSVRIDDQLDLAILSKQIYSLFETSDVLRKFDVELVSQQEKKKRTEIGYVSNFLVLKTRYGKIEMQLQSEHEHREGNYGYSAHSKIVGKEFDPFPIPKKGDKQALKEFRTCVEFVSPKKFLAKYDDAERDRVLTQVFGKYQNYKSILMQVQRGTEHEKKLEEYFLRIYNRKMELFSGEARQDHVEGFTPSDIDIFLKKKEFNKDIKDRD